ncbi:legumain-like [Salminus brasiliensis]|uniref:legumain-like n=1 Tax=Salminus brasiliensis TaxID=930266 RepID=UPI003B830F8D
MTYRYQMGETQSKQWVLLAAGSTGWNNYRHQADVCHAYQMVHHNGIPDEQIVVMMYDDIAYNADNPNPGEIINEPDGPNVYPGVLKDYTGHDVSASNFLAVLCGDESGVKKQRRGPKKVLKSGKNDTIFVYLSDHGGKGLFAFPSDTLHAYDLVDTITKMSRCHQFSKMVIYMESCFSGSMIEHLPKNINVHAVSAANPWTSSYSCYLDEHRHTYLADEFTSCWLLHCRMSDLTRTTFQDQFQYLRCNVTESTPCHYGNTELSKLAVGDFLGCPDPETQAEHSHKANSFAPTHLTPSHEVPLMILKKKIESERNLEKRGALERDLCKLEQKRARIKRAVNAIATHPNAKTIKGGRAHCPLTHLRNMKDIAEHFRLTFSGWHEDQSIE